MKIFVTLFGFVGLLSTLGFSQTENSFSSDIQPLQLELENWDPIRGPWLSSSLMALSQNEPIPDRTFPEDVTPSEMIQNLPENTRAGMEQVILRHKNSSNDSWNVYRNMILRPNAGCRTYSSRSYGDPHIQTFDGARYSFQTVGEFVLMKSSNGMEVQARQGAQGDDFSVNTAVAMNVGGDRVALYMRSTPDGINTTPLRINSQPIVTHGAKAIFLPSGGTVRKTGKVYLITWPTGEKVQATTSGSVGRGFLNVSVVINECNKGFVTGLLGNANGNRRDDFDREMDFSSVNAAADPFDLFDTRVNSTIQRRNLAYIANIVADRFRVTPATSLFDYPFGRSTYDFTDRSFPRVHRTVHDLSRSRFNNARENCLRAGVSQADLNGCIFDNGFLDFTPTPRTVVQDSRDVSWTPISQPTRNVNDGNIIVKQPNDRVVREVRGNSGGSVRTVRPRLTPAPEIRGNVRDVKPLEDNNVRGSGRLTPYPQKEVRATKVPVVRGTGTVSNQPNTRVRINTNPTRNTPTRTRTSPTIQPNTRVVSPSRTRTSPTRTTSPSRVASPSRTTPSTPSRSTPSLQKGNFGGIGGKR